MWFTFPLASLNRIFRRHEEGVYCRRKTRCKTAPQRRRFVPRLEILENRTLPSTFMVINLNDSGPGSLRQAIIDANPGANAIDFRPGLQGTIGLTTGELAITGTVAINGPGANKLAVSGNGASRVFDVLGGTATIAGLTITHGLADKNAPVFASTGGGILNLGALTLSNDVLSANEARGDASVSPFGSSGLALGGGIANVGLLTVSGTTVTSNRAQGADRAQSILPSNAAGLAKGGGIENAGSLTISNSTITSNQALGGSDCSSRFFPGNAGAGGLSNEAGSVASVTDSQFTFNLAKGGDGGTSLSSGAGIAGGGAIENFSGTLTVARSTFSHNQAIGGNDNVSAFSPGLGHGGAIKSGTLSTTSATLVVSSSTFDHNQAIGGNGNHVTTPESSSLGADCGLGAGVDVFGGTGTISDSAFDHNYAIGGAGRTGDNGGLGAGGGILADSFVPGVSVTVSRCTVDHNLALGGQAGAGGTGGDGRGGGVANLMRATLSVSGSTITYNQAQGGDGATGGPASSGGSGLGAGLLNDSFSTLTVIGSTITHNQAQGGPGHNEGEGGVGVGGGVHNLGTLTVDRFTVIEENHASTSHDDVFDHGRPSAALTDDKPDDPSAQRGVNMVSTDPNDWPMFTHDSSGSRFNSAETQLRPDNVSGLKVQWTFPTQSAIAGTPAAVDNVVYAIDASGTVYAVSRDGRELWEHRVTVHPPRALPFTPALQVTTSLLVTNHTIIFGDLGGDIHGLDVNTGAELWTVRPNDTPAASIFGSAIMVGHDVAIGISSTEELAMLVTPHYVPSFRGSVVLLDPTDGHVIWQTYTISPAQRAAGATGSAVWSTPTYDPASNTIYVTTGNNYTAPTTATSDAFIALDAADGHIKWVNQLTRGDLWNHTFPQGREHPDFDFADSPHLYSIGGRKVVGAGEKSGFYFVLDAVTGAEIGSPLQVAPEGQLGGVFADSAVANGVVYANGTNWPNVLGGSPPLGGLLTAIAGDGSKEVWQSLTPAPNESGVAVANGVVYFQSLDGNLYVLDAAKGKVLATVRTGGFGRDSGPAISRGQVYFGTGDVLDGAFDETLVFGPGAIVALGLGDEPRESGMQARGRPDAGSLFVAVDQMPFNRNETFGVDLIVPPGGLLGPLQNPQSHGMVFSQFQFHDANYKLIGDPSAITSLQVAQVNPSVSLDTPLVRTTSNHKRIRFGRDSFTGSWLTNGLTPGADKITAFHP